MENGRIINRIKSIYIIKNIFNYIKDSNLQLKLFIYSKHFQNVFNIKLITYKEEYLKKIGFNFEDYLYSEVEDYERDFLREKYENFIVENKLNKEKFEDTIYEVLENKKINDIDEEEVNKINKDHEKLIDINSPLFDIISKTKLFEKNISIYISQNHATTKPKYDYLKFFDKLNKSNIKYSSIYYDFYELYKINYLNEFNIDFNKIKKLTLNINNKIEDEKNNYFFETLFSFNNIENNLIYLKIYFNEYNGIYLSPELFEKINNFKSLKYLYIHKFNFNKNFNVKILYIAV